MVCGLHEPAPRLVRRWWAGLAQLSAGMVAAAVAVVVSLSLAQRPQPLARTPSSAVAPVRLAQSSGSDESWLEETMQLLDALNEEPPAETGGADVSDDDWLRELDTLEPRDDATPS